MTFKPHVLTGDRPAPRYMFVPGDPGRVALIGSGWDEYAKISFNREFRYENALPLPLELPELGIARMRGYGVATFEMEAAALFVLGTLLKRRCGSICWVESNRATGERRPVTHAIHDAIAVANRAVVIVADWDERRQRAGRRHFSPSLLSTPIGG